MTVPAKPVPRWQRPVIIGVVALIVIVAGGIWYWQANRKGVSFSAVFSESVGIYPGSDVRILGVPVGEVDSVTPKGTDVVVSMHVDPGIHVAAGTYAVIISPTLVGDRYVQLTGVYSSGPKLTSGTRLPIARTRTPVELDTLYRNLISLTDALGTKGANKNGALNQLLVTAAANLQGNGKNLNVTLRNLSQASAAFGDSKDNIAASLDQLSTFTQMLQQNNQGVVAVNQQLATFAQTLAGDRDTFAEAMKDLGSALALVQRFVQENRAALTSNVTKLSAVAQALASERDSLTKAVGAAPLLVQNFLNAYDPTHNVLRGRADLNEVGAWATTTGTSSTVPTMLPSAGTTTVGSGG